MKIENIKINSFGTLKNKEINLDKNVNIIYGKNESGKSTLLTYIKTAFYGISKNKNGKQISDFDKYKPWSGEEFSGKIKYILDDGSKYEIFRDFNKKNAKIYNDNLEDITKQFNMDKKEGSQFFIEQVGLDENMFTSTIMSGQQEVKLNEQQQRKIYKALGDSKITENKAEELRKLANTFDEFTVDIIKENFNGDKNTIKSSIKFTKKEMEKYFSDFKSIKEIKEYLIRLLEEIDEKSENSPYGEKYY